MSGFSSIKAQLSHSSKINGIATPAELKPLGDLITNSKTVIASSNKLSTDWKRSADVLKDWANTQQQGDDLSGL